MHVCVRSFSNIKKSVVLVHRPNPDLLPDGNVFSLKSCTASELHSGMSAGADH